MSTDPNTLSHRAAESIRRAIREGRLAAGELYSVAGLAEEFGVSRTPVREALLVLERQGMVRFERNRGVRVLETTARDVEEIFALRLLLEVPAAARACRLIGVNGLSQIHRELENMRRAAETGDEALFMTYDQRFHEQILSAAGNSRLTAIIGNLRDHVTSRGPSTVGRSRSLDAVLAEHEAIMDALEASDEARTAAAMREHLVTTGRLLVQQQGGAEDGSSWEDWGSGS
ncbi:GntR family transcriptional regulator [Streptomyces sp. NPDC001393]